MVKAVELKISPVELFLLPDHVEACHSETRVFLKFRIFFQVRLSKRSNLLQKPFRVLLG